MADSEIIYITVEPPAAEIEVIEVSDPAGSGSSVASGVAFIPVGNLSSTDVQAALAELDSEKLAVSANLAAIAGLVSAADRLPYFTGSGTASLAVFTAAGRSMVAAIDAAAQRSLLGLGGAALLNVGTTTGTVAAGNDSRITGAVQTGGALGTPSSGNLGNCSGLPTAGLNFAATQRIHGRKTAGAGAAEECTLSDILDFVGGATRGDILFRGAAGWVRLPAGTDGYVLQTHGASADPTWALAGGAAVDGSNITTPSNWRSKIDVPSQADINSRFSGALGGVTFDGVTTNQRAYASLLDWNIGTSDFSVVTKLDIPVAIPANHSPLWAFSSSSSSAAPFSLTCRIEASTGSFQIFISGTTQDSYRRLYYNGFLSVYGGQTVFVTVTRTAGVIAVYVDGTDITASFSEFTNAGSGVMPASWAESISSAWFLIGGIGASGAGYNGRIVRCAPFNYAMTLAQILAFRSGGVTSSEQWGYVHGCNSVINDERNVNFSRAATDWLKTGAGASISPAGAVVLGAAGESVSLSAISGFIGQLVPGDLYRLSFDIAAGTFGGNSVNAYWGVAVNGTEINLGAFSANGSVCFEFTPTFGLGVLSLVAITGGSSFTLSNVKLTRVIVANGTFETAGSPLAFWTPYAAGSSTVTRDTTQQRSGAACAALNVVSTADCYIVQSLLTVGRKYRARFWAKCSAGTHSVAIGGPTTSSQVSQLVTTTWTQYTLVLPVATSSLFQIERLSSDTGTYTLYIDDVEVIEDGPYSDFSAAGLDNMTPMWRNASPLFPDATLVNLLQDTTGRWIGINSAEGKSWSAHGQLGRLSRETGAQSLGGIYLPGNSNQRLTISNSQDIGVNSFWTRIQISMPSSNPGSTRGLFCFSGSSTPGAAANAFTGQLTTSGSLEIAIYGASGSDYRIASVADAVLRFGGRVIDVVICRTSTGALLVWINEGRQAYVESVAGTPPQFTGSISSTYIFWAASSTTSVFTGEFNRVQLGRGTLTDALVRQLLNAGVGTGSGAAAGTPISRGGIVGSTDGLVIDLDLTQGSGYVYPDMASATQTAVGIGAFVAVSNLCDETHKLPSRVSGLNYQLANTRFSGAASNGSTALTAYGDVFTVQGTPSSSAASATQPHCINIVSAASAGSFAGYYSSSIHYIGRNPRFAALVRLVDLTNVAVWVGFHNGTASGLNTDTPLLSVAAFRFSPTRAGDTTWKCITANGSTQTVGESNVVPTGNMVLLEIEVISGQRVNFYIDGRLVCTNTLTLPQSSASCRWQEVLETRDATGRNIRFVETNINS